MNNPKFDSVLKKMSEMHNSKSEDYAQATNRYSNFENAAVSAGIPVDAVFRTMIGIKLARLAELQGKGKTPKNESIMDSLIDLAVYATLYASYYEDLPNVFYNNVVMDIKPKPFDYRDAVIGEHLDD